MRLGEHGRVAARAAASATKRRRPSSGPLLKASYSRPIQADVRKPKSPIEVYGPGGSSSAAGQRVRLMGVPVGAVTEADAVAAVIDATTAQRGHWTITANLDHLRRYQHDSLAKRLVDEADLVVADGMPLVWASWLAGAPLPQRVAGSNLIWSISDAARNHGHSLFLLGGDPGVAERAALILADRYPGLKMAGTACPPMGFEGNPDELARIRDEVTSAAPQIVFVALGFPKQDVLIRELRSSLPGAAFLGVGISLSYITGDVVRAPRWTHRLGLEWAYRLSQEPARLGRRYLVHGLPFAIRMMASALLHRLSGTSKEARWGSDDHDKLPYTSTNARH